MDMQTVVVALLGGGAVGFIQFLIQRKDSKAEKNSAILNAIEKLEMKILTLEDKIDKVGAKDDARNAESRRRNILRFADEMLSEMKHSKDSWDNCMDDITEYEKYCETHPEFKNSQAVATIEYIKKNYAERLEKHDFM